MRPGFDSRTVQYVFKWDNSLFNFSIFILKSVFSIVIMHYCPIVVIDVPYGLVVRIPAFHAGGPGSIPGVGELFN